MLARWSDVRDSYTDPRITGDARGTEERIAPDDGRQEGVPVKVGVAPDRAAAFVDLRQQNGE